MRVLVRQDVSEDLVHLKGLPPPSSQAENMLLRSHLILICHSECSRAFAPCCPLANSELFVALQSPDAFTLPVLVPQFNLACFPQPPLHLFVPLSLLIFPRPSTVTLLQLCIL